MEVGMYYEFISILSINLLTESAAITGKYQPEVWTEPGGWGPYMKDGGLLNSALKYMVQWFESRI